MFFTGVICFAPAILTLKITVDAGVFKVGEPLKAPGETTVKADGQFTPSESSLKRLAAGKAGLLPIYLSAEFRFVVR